MMTFAIAGISPTPALIRDYAGNTAVFDTIDPVTYERHVRAVSNVMGGMVTVVENPMSAADLQGSIVPETLSFSMELGRLLLSNRGRAAQIVEPLKDLFRSSIYGCCDRLFSGKVVDHSTTVVGGYDVGSVTVVPFDGDGPSLTLDVKNEFLVARIDGEVVGSVPDLISLVDDETSEPINAERLRYGHRVSVFGVGCPDVYRTPEALAVAGPRAFGFDLDFVPLEQRRPG